MSSKKIERKSLNSPDETRPAGKAKAELVNLGGFTIARFTAEPGWKWSTDVKPIVKTDSCQLSHAGVIVSGRLITVMDDGTRVEFGPSDAFSIPPGHDGWVVGDEPMVGIEFSGTSAEFAKPK